MLMKTSYIPATLETMSIPSLDINQNIDRLDMAVDRSMGSPSMQVSPQPGPLICNEVGDQSNSEDSSLSDSDRTLVGEAPGIFKFNFIPIIKAD